VAIGNDAAAIEGACLRRIGRRAAETSEAFMLLAKRCACVWLT
jgi:hypothetical protein